MTEVKWSVVHGCFLSHFVFSINLQSKCIDLEFSKHLPLDNRNECAPIICD